MGDVKKGAGQIGGAPFALARILVKAPEGVPMCGADVITGELYDLAAEPLRTGAFFADVFAFARGERRQKPLEIRVVFVGPVKLLARPVHEAHFLARGDLIIGAEVPAEALGSNRCFALPGQSYRIGDMVDAMRRIAGEDAAQRIRWEPDPDIGRIVSGWPERIDAAKALSLGFVRDESFEDNVRYFLEDDLETQP